MNEKRLVRAHDDKVILGVSGGLGRYFGIDPVVVRILFVVAFLASAGHAALAYILLAILMPQVHSAPAKAHPFEPTEEIVIKDSP